MKLQHHLLAVLAAGLFAGMAIAQPAAAPAKLSTSDRMFLSDALGTNQLEIDMSAYAIKQAHADKVRAFAKARVDEHKALAARFQKANDGIVPAPGPSTQPGINLLGKTGADFDRTYVGLMANYDHRLATRFAGADGPQHGTAIREMVRDTLPILRRHEAEANALERTLPAN